jgi:membrane-associated PAP2 superfamily phosphatase
VTPESEAADLRAHWIALVVIAVVGTLPFWVSDLDLRVAAWFYDPTAVDPWPASQQPVWLLLYQAAPVLVGLVMLGSLVTLTGGLLWPRLARMRPQAALVLAVMILGPGLVVNAVLKEHWGRPRPHQILELGGTQAFVPPLAMGEQRTGKSFPCGHSSVGFALAVFFLIWRRRRPGLALAALTGALALGTLLGVGRMAAGDHFLSDVIWSGVIVYGVALPLYVVMRIPEREDAMADRPLAESVAARHPMLLGAAFTGCAAGMLAAVLAATPVHDNRTVLIQRADLAGPPGALRIVADQAQVVVDWHGHADEAARILVKGRGFGLPGTRVLNTLERSDGDVTLEISHRGVFSEKDTSITLIAHPRAWSRIEIATVSGDIRVHATPEGTPELSLETGDGQVLRDDV